jgi:hypothetical protein
VYPPANGERRWRAVWYEDGKRRQCQSVSNDRQMLEKVIALLAVGARNTERPGSELIAWYLNPDRLPVGDGGVTPSRA